MELRVAQALAAELGGIEGWVDYETCARAVIRAMRQPSVAMYSIANLIEAKNKTDLRSFDVTGFCVLVYIAMIDAASPP